MPNHKNLVRIALVMVVVFGLITILYPRLFAPTSHEPVAAPATAAP